MESLHGLTKGTELEPMIKQAMMAEANGTMMYYALARLAKEQGFDDIAETFIASANQEAVHFCKAGRSSRRSFERNFGKI